MRIAPPCCVLWPCRGEAPTASPSPPALCNHAAGLQEHHCRTPSLACRSSSAGDPHLTLYLGLEGANAVRQRPR
jgi:hypothetical protein